MHKLLSILFFLLVSLTYFSQNQEKKWFEGKYEVNYDKNSIHSIWNTLTYISVYDEKENLNPIEHDSIEIKLIDEKLIQISLIRNYNIIKSVSQKVKIKNDKLKIKRKWNIAGIPPLFWGLGWRRTIIKQENSTIKIKSSFGGVAFFTIIPFTVNSPNIPDLIIEKIN